ncbi:MAG: helix-turn-helix domain-containing protein [Candidatus Coproplasma sp.]
MFIDIFNDLLDEKELNRKQFAEKSGIPYTTIIGWTAHNRLPDYAALIKIADFFNCSVDYLMGRQDDWNNTLIPVEILQSEQALLKNFRKLDTENKELILKLTKNLKNSEQNKDKKN